MNCTRCQGTGFLNSEQIPEDVAGQGVEEILEWVQRETGHDVTVCDCCGDGEASWYGEPGQHYTTQDPVGKHGPYAYNGGLCECH
jgi:hypothetical protein